MGGLYSLTTAAVQGLTRKIFGTQIPTSYQANLDTGEVTPVEGGMTKDTGVQEAINELVARLASTAPINMPDSLDLVLPGNAPAFNILVDSTKTIGDGGGGGRVEVFNITNVYENNTTVIYNDGTISNIDGNGNETPIVTQPTGFTGSLTVLTGASVSVVGCTATVTATTKTVTYQNGQVVNVQD